MGGLDGPESLVELYDAHAAQLYNYVVRRAGPAVADDLVSETFLIVWAQRARFDQTRASAKSWLFGVATNLLRRHFRAEARRLDAWTRELARQIHVEDVGARASSAADADALAGELAEELAKLRTEEREALLLVAWGDLGPSEIAEAMGVPAATVRTWLHRARSRLRNRAAATTTARTTRSER
ncbi:RNA polymerase sigma factor [Goodfellowiella coeruleoviolacea]|uniref:RNA polymerase sigma factor n=1 Tax=Goodfellowiella coeruleoviolacea TaxID=334858 RepID=UPI0020A507C6|nr:RNA polymerase sigma factor [Goodfellowiella coeruleoviolacea]